MGILQGSKADDLTPQRAESIVLVGAFNITAAPNVPEIVPNFEIILSLPAVYYITALIRAQVEISAGVDGFIASCLVTTPLASGTPTVLINNCGISGQIAQLNQFADSQGAATALVTITEPTKIQVEVRRKGISATPTFITSRVIDDANGGTSLTAIQLIN